MVRLPPVAQRTPQLPVILAVVAVVTAAYILGSHASATLLIIPVAVVAGLAILRQPRLGLFAIVAVALLIYRSIGTGSDVNLYPVALLVPVIVGIWLLSSLLRRQLRLPASPLNLPLILFLAAGLLSLFIGNLTWDPAVPRKDNFLLVQIAQWAIFAFSAFAMWMTASLIDRERWLKQLTIAFLVIGGVLALLRVWPPVYELFLVISSGAVDRAPFWVLLVGLAGGQLLFNTKLQRGTQLLLVVLIAVAGYFALVFVREVASYWVGIATVVGVLIWLRFPKLRVPLVLVVALLLATGVISRSVWDFAGGEGEWEESGASRLVLIQRVIEVTMRNPITGLGPAAYRPYVNMKPLLYGNAFWINPTVNSHNNYVDLFAHTGLLGLGLYLWFMAEAVLLGIRLHLRYARGFIAGYVNGMLACLAAVLVLMFLLDWFLPFVYNVSFYGFQSSVLVWLFLGGLIAIDQWPAPVVAVPAPVTRRIVRANPGTFRPSR